MGSGVNAVCVGNPLHVLVAPSGLWLAGSPCQSQLCLVCRIHSWRLCATVLLLPCKVCVYVARVFYNLSEQTLWLNRMPMRHVRAVDVNFITNKYFWFPASPFVVVVLISLWCPCYASSNRCLHEPHTFGQSLSLASIWDWACFGIFKAVPVKRPNDVEDGSSLGRVILNVDVLGAL